MPATQTPHRLIGTLASTVCMATATVGGEHSALVPPVSLGGLVPEPLPKGSRLLHIGPPKTGTTSLQSALAHSRDALLEHGVYYAGDQWTAPNAALGLSPHVRNRPMGGWNTLVTRIASCDADRVVISSEVFAHADGDAADGILDAFGRDRTHVVITMRPLADMLSSSWWQYVQAGAVMPYEEWLQKVLREDPEGRTTTPSFWRRSWIDVIAQRWAERVGPENVTLIALGGQPRDFLNRTFEELLGLPAGLLDSDGAKSNSTLPFPVLELTREFNRVAKTEGRSKDRAVHLNRMTALNVVKRQPDVLSNDTRIETPAWAADVASDIAAQMNDRIRTLGINVVGDLDELARPSRPAPAEVPPAPTLIPIQDAAVVMYRMMVAAERRTTAALTKDFAQREARQEERRVRRAERAQRQAVRQALKARPRPEAIGGRDLVRLLARRTKRRIRRG